MAVLSDAFDGDRDAPSAPSATPLHDFARTLIKQLGFEEAVRLCRANHWDGVLKAIRATR